MTIETLTELQYSKDRKGPWQLYIYEPNSEYHHGGIWFMAKPLYPEEGEITIEQARQLALNAVEEKREVRIVDGGDMLVFHSRDGRTLYPKDEVKFWDDIAA
jgi:hypothetical protein